MYIHVSFLLKAIKVNSIIFTILSASSEINYYFNQFFFLANSYSNISCDRAGIRLFSFPAHGLYSWTNSITTTQGFGKFPFQFNIR